MKSIIITSVHRQGSSIHEHQKTNFRIVSKSTTIKGKTLLMAFLLLFVQGAYSFNQVSRELVSTDSVGFEVALCIPTFIIVLLFLKLKNGLKRQRLNNALATYSPTPALTLSKYVSKLIHLATLTQNRYIFYRGKIFDTKVCQTSQILTN